jgi:predicted phage terminase large subunit-like protein
MSLTVEEAVLLGAKDTIFFGHYFFPRTMRQKSPQFHYTICEKIEEPANRQIAVKVLRGGAKTSLTRIIMAKRIAYALSNTMLILSETSGHSVKTVRWLKRAVESNELFRNTFGLKQGAKWTEDEIEIENTVLGIKINIVGSGIFGQTRGLNIDDYRPDFILLDDPHDEENSATPEMRKKVKDIIYGAILQSLAPRSECPTAKIVMLQTPLHREDAIECAMNDPTWCSIAVSVFNEDGQSVWPERWSTEELLAEKEGYRARNQLSVWYREKEVTVTSDELSYFLPGWLKYYEIPPEKPVCLIGIDPTPPPKDSQQLGNTAKLDDAVIFVIGISQKKVYLLEYYECKSPDPREFIEKIFELHMRWRPINTGIETFLFQRVMKTYVEENMQRKRYYFAITAIEDARKKSIRIRQAITDYASQGQLYVHKSMTKFLDQYHGYPNVNHDDVLDALSIALGLLTPAVLESIESTIIEGEYSVVEDEKLLEAFRQCP